MSRENIYVSAQGGLLIAKVEPSDVRIVHDISGGRYEIIIHGVTVHACDEGNAEEAHMLYARIRDLLVA
jgi:glycerate-2-kinase